MKVPAGLKITVLMLGSTLFYAYVGQLVPQKEVHPPEVLELSKDMTVEEMLATGEQIMNGKGICLTCHTIGRSGALRFPDLGGIGSRAGTRVEGLSDVEYLVESMIAPESYIVPGFTGGMPVIDRPPIGLTDQEIVTVVAYLQNLGGEVTVTMATDIRNLDAEIEEVDADGVGVEESDGTTEPASNNNSGGGQ